MTNNTVSFETGSSESKLFVPESGSLYRVDDRCGFWYGLASLPESLNMKRDSLSHEFAKRVKVFSGRAYPGKSGANAPGSQRHAR